MQLTCKKCGKIGALEEFIKDKRADIGYRPKCKECERVRLRKYQRENRDKVNEANRNSYHKNREARLDSCKRYSEENKERISEAARQRYIRNRDSILKKCKVYRSNNKEVLRAGWLRRRARERAMASDLGTKEFISLLNRFGNTCAISGEVSEHLDHFIPLSTGHLGTTYSNLIPLSAHLNLSKNGRNPFVWAETLNVEYQQNFNKVIEYLAELNGLTVDEYREFVFWCFENKREAHEITDDNRDSLALWLRTKKNAA